MEKQCRTRLWVRHVLFGICPCLSLWERCPEWGGEGVFTLSVGFAASSPKGRAKWRSIEGSRTLEGDCHTSDVGHWFPMTVFFCFYSVKQNDTERYPMV